MSEYTKNDIVQIIDDAHPWYPALLIVDEVKTWGVQAYCHIPTANDSNNTQQAFTRLNNEQIERVGIAAIVAQGGEDEQV